MCKLTFVANMKTNIRELKYSSRRYRVSPTGTVLDIDNNIIKPFLKDGHLCVSLSWLNGVADYKVATLVMYTYRRIALPDYLLNRIEPLYIDGDINNLICSNLIYRFADGPIELEDFPGYHYIPMFTSYAISTSGDILNWETRKHKSWSITRPVIEKNSKGGYAYNRIVNEEGCSVTLFRHRAMCMTYLQYDENVLNLVINHKDGTPGNDNLKNLEFATYRENSIHAFKNGLRGDNKPVLSKDLKTGEIKKFSSCNECAQYYGYPQGCHVRYRINSNKVHSDFIIFKDDDGSEWPVIDVDKVKIHIAKNSNFIFGRNVFTGEIIRFSGTARGSEETGVKEATILKHARESANIPVNGWNFRYEHLAVSWPIHSKRHLLIYEDYPIYPPDGLVVLNTETNVETFFTSVAKGCNELKINKSMVYASIRHDKAVMGKWKFTLFDIRKNLSLPTEKSVEK